MKTLLRVLLLSTLTLCAPAYAGGPVITQEEPFLEDVSPQGDGGKWVVPVIVGAIILCAIACGSDGGPAVVTPPPCNDDGDTC